MLHRFTSAVQGVLLAIGRISHSSLLLPPTAHSPRGRWTLAHFSSSLGEAMKHSRQPKSEVKGSPGLKSSARD
jgi:hypothetical protein